MIEIIEDLPADILGVALRGKISEEDYKEILIPAAEKKMKDHGGKIKMLVYIGEFEGMELAAMWQDTKFGLQHWSDFTHVALVTDMDWIKSITAFFAPFIPGEVRIYGTNRESEAKEWIMSPAKAAG